MLRRALCLALLLGSVPLAMGADILPNPMTRKKAAPDPPKFVDLHDRAPAAKIEMRYAKADNFLHEAVYPCARCLLREDAAVALAAVQKDLDEKRLILLLWDCYRPPAVQQAMWKIEPDARFVADPKTGSVHNRGGAVDISLADAYTRAPLEMPTAHDDFSEKAYADAPANEIATKNRATLRAAMEKHGFTVMKTEWWHFDFNGSKAWPIEEVPLCAK